MDRVAYPENIPPKQYDDKAKNKVKVHADRVWYDNGYRSAKKDEVILVDDDDMHMLIEAGQVAKLGQDPKPPPKKEEPHAIKRTHHFAGETPE